MKKKYILMIFIIGVVIYITINFKPIYLFAETILGIARESSLEEKKAQDALEISKLIIESNRNKQFDEIDYDSSSVGITRDETNKSIKFEFKFNNFNYAENYNYELIYYENGHNMERYIENKNEGWNEIYKIFDEKWFLKKSSNDA